MSAITQLSNIALVPYVLAALIFLWAKGYRSWQRGRFFRALKNGLKMGSVKSLEDVKAIFDGIYGPQFQAETHIGSLALLLKRVSAMLNEKADPSASSARPLMSSFIKECETLSPYADLPKKERTIFMDVEAHLRAQQTDDIHRKLTELASVFKLQHDQNEKLEKGNKWSISLAVIGIIVSIILGIQVRH